MKKSLVLLTILSLVLGLSASAQVKFKDMADDHWAASAVYDLVKRGITGGFPDGTFRGNETLSRYQTAVFLNKMALSIEKKIPSDSKISRMIDQAIAKRGGAGGGSDVSGILFIRYLKGLSNSSVVNNFDIERASIIIKKQVGDKAKAKVVLDSGRTTGRLNTFVKYAFVDLTDTLPEGLIPGGNMDVRLGMQPTFWSTWVDGILGLRVVANSMVFQDGGITTSDFGAGILGRVGIAGIPKINYLFTALNGSSFSSAEANSAKNLAGRIDSEVIPGVTVGVGGHIEDVDSSGTGRKLATGIVAYKADTLKAYAELMYGKGGIGYSVAGTYDITEKWTIFSRVDIADPDRDTGDDQTTRMYAGVIKKWNPNVKLIADIETMTVGTGDTSSQLALRSQINL